MANEKYWSKLAHAEEVLTPFLGMIHSNWNAQAVADWIGHFFSTAKKNDWSDRGVRVHANGNFFDRNAKKIGMRIWSTVACLSDGQWTEDRYFELNFGEWPKPPLSPKPDNMALPRQANSSSAFKTRINGAKSPLDITQTSENERRRNREVWAKLFDEIAFLNNTPDVATYERDPHYGMPCFTFGGENFRDAIWSTCMHGLHQSTLCVEVIRPLYFRAMYDVRVLIPRRISARQAKQSLKKREIELKLHDPPADSEEFRILPLLDLCQFCLRPLRRKLGARKVRSDSKFCGTACKNAFNNRKGLT